MLDLYGIEANRRALLADLKQLIEEALQPFADDLREFLERVRGGQFGRDWRGAWDNFVETQADAGFNIEADSVTRLVRLMESWERQMPDARASGPTTIAVQSGHHAAPVGTTAPPMIALRSAVESLETARAPEPLATTFVHGKTTAPHPKNGKQFFDSKLDVAQACLDAMKEALEALGQKLDASKIDELVDIDSEVDAVEELIWRYNDSIESARGIWLRENLSADDNTRLLQMSTPASFGLPLFLDESQADRSRSQLLQISQRLGVNDRKRDYFYYMASGADLAGTGAGLLLGGGTIAKAAKTGGRWAVIKTVAVAAGASAVDYGAESGLRWAGASETSIRGARLAALVIGAILRRRRAGTPPSPNSPGSTGRGSTRVESEVIGAEFATTKKRPFILTPIEGTPDKNRSPAHTFLQITVAKKCKQRAYISESSGTRRWGDSWV